MVGLLRIAPAARAVAVARCATPRLRPAKADGLTNASVTTKNRRVAKAVAARITDMFAYGTPGWERGKSALAAGWGFYPPWVVQSRWCRVEWCS